MWNNLSYLPYNRKAAVDYANKWALSRNPNFYDYSQLGGDCTNFASQVLLAGGASMNYYPTLGWYYIDPNRKSPSWTGVDFLYNFLISNRTKGPFGREVTPTMIEVGDLIQLSYQEGRFNHTLVVTKLESPIEIGRIFVSAHSIDRHNSNLTQTYSWKQIRFLHIIGNLQ